MSHGPLSRGQATGGYTGIGRWLLPDGQRSSHPCSTPQCTLLQHGSLWKRSSRVHPTLSNGRLYHARIYCDGGATGTQRQIHSGDRQRKRLPVTLKLEHFKPKLHRHRVEIRDSPPLEHLYFGCPSFLLRCQWAFNSTMPKLPARRGPTEHQHLGLRLSRDRPANGPDPQMAAGAPTLPPLSHSVFGLFSRETMADRSPSLTDLLMVLDTLEWLTEPQSACVCAMPTGCPAPVCARWTFTETAPPHRPTVTFLWLTWYRPSDGSQSYSPCFNGSLDA